MTKTAKQTYLTGKGVVQIRAVKEEEGEEDCGLHVSLGKAARVQMPEASAFAPPKVALRSVAWSADEDNGRRSRRAAVRGSSWWWVALLCRFRRASQTRRFLQLAVTDQSAALRAQAGDVLQKERLLLRHPTPRA